MDAQSPQLREIERLLYDYAHAIDTGDRRAWVNCFTPTATMTVVRHGTLLYEMVGRAQLQSFIDAHKRPPEFVFKHLVLNVRAQVFGEVVRASSYFVRLDAQGGAPTVFAFGRYEDAVVRNQDGDWKIDRRHCEIEAGGPQRGAQE